ncbi:MAG TPA: LapA family protein [Bryobacteraceae bacterium]|jgi:CcmD family protein|nr:LapA family protein [Bryobacteraceae bacterium]HXR77397.1 LapA family protein [Bryobacteraceae bacterium]
MDTRNFLFMFYGFLAAWVIVMIYIITLARRNSRLKRELDDVKRLLDVKETRAEDRTASLPHGRGSVQG